MSAQAIIVENGSMPDGANSYVSLADFKSWATDNGYDLTGKDDDVITRGILSACDYINALPFIGAPAMQYRAMAWPRLDVGLDAKIPAQIVKAQCWLAANVISGTIELFPSEREKSIKREKVGPIDTEYFDNSVNSEPSESGRFPFIASLLAPFLSGGDSSNGTIQRVSL
jgi:hypothetical protein